MISQSSSHDEAVQEMYKNIQLPKDCTTAVAIAQEATRQLSAITFIIENERCFIVMPENISLKQMEKVMPMLQSASEEAVIGLFVHDKKKNKDCRENDFYLERADGDREDLTKTETMNIVAKLNPKVYKEYEWKKSLKIKEQPKPPNLKPPQQDNKGWEREGE